MSEGIISHFLGIGPQKKKAFLLASLQHHPKRVPSQKDRVDSWVTGIPRIKVDQLTDGFP